MTTTTDDNWYHQMSLAMRERDRALTGVARWQEALVEAEAKIQALRESDVADQVPARNAALVDQPAEPEPAR